MKKLLYCTNDDMKKLYVWLKKKIPGVRKVLFRRDWFSSRYYMLFEYENETHYVYVAQSMDSINSKNLTLEEVNLSSFFQNYGNWVVCDNFDYNWYKLPKDELELEIELSIGDK